MSAKTRSGLILLVLFVLVFSSCNQNILTSKKVHIVIPVHPWEESGNIKLWYSLKWNSHGKIETLYLDTETREIDLRIDRDCCVFVCAYPLGEMLPFGTAISPDCSRREVVLNQNEGYLGHLLLNSDVRAAGHVNFEKLLEKISVETDDFRTVDDSVLVADVLNGCLGSSSVEIREKYQVENISVPNGKWVSEFKYDGCLFVTDGKTGRLELSPGVFRYYCEELDREFRVVVDPNGAVFHSLRYGMTGL